MTEISKKDWQKIEKTFSRYAKIIGEEFKSQIRPIAEMQKSQGKKIDDLYKKFNELKEMVALNTVDITVMKEDIATIKKEIMEIKSELKNKSDINKVEHIEKELTILKQKIA